MLEVLYRIYEVADKETVEINKQRNIDFSLYTSTSQAKNILLLTDCLICDSREHFKDIIKDTYGKDIPFRYSKKLGAGRVYCIIIGEHAYNVERFFCKVKYKCDCCKAEIETYYGKPICFSDWEVRQNFYGIQEYNKKRFCSQKCKQVFKQEERAKIKPDCDDGNFFITKDMFTENVSVYIYKITKKSTGEFYIGQTVFAPVFRWGQHLKTDRFDIKNILDYQFEVICIVPKGENILEVEKKYIKQYYMENPELSLNIACITNEMKQGQMVL